MKFRYLGDKKDMKVFGYDFSKGATPDVTDENAIKRLSGNTDFEIVKEEPAKDAQKGPAKDATKEQMPFGDSITKATAQHKDPAKPL